MAKTSFGTTDIYKVSVGDLYNITKISIGDKLVYTAGNTVTYHVDTNTTYTEDVDADETVLSPKSFIPEKTGWQFVGWKQNTQADSKVETDLNMGDSPITLYAVFKQAITVTYYNGNTTKQTAVEYRYYNNGNSTNPTFTINQADLTGSGWHAIGWSIGTTANAAISYPALSNTSISADVTLYAMYTANITLSYSNNGGTGNMASSTGTSYYNSGSGATLYPSFTLAANGFSKAHYNFVRWRMGSTSGTAYNVGAKVTLQSGTVFYAEWALASHTVTYIYNGASTTRTVSYGSSVLSPGFTPSLSGCSFLGWTNNKSSASALTSLTMGDSNITLYAVWKASNKNITAYQNATYHEADYVYYGTPLNFLAFSETVDTSMYSGVYINARQIFIPLNMFRGQAFQCQVYVSDGTVGTIATLSRSWTSPGNDYFPVTVSTGYGLKYTTDNDTNANISNQTFTVNFTTSNNTSAKIYWRLNCVSGSSENNSYKPSFFTHVNQCYLVGRQFAR